MTKLKNLTTNEKINLRMAELLAFYTVTKLPHLRKLVPSSLKGTSRYNTCYDFISKRPPQSALEQQIRQASDTVKNLLRNNLDDNYLKLTALPGPIGIRLSYSVIDELPSDYKDLERTGFVVFMKAEEVEGLV